MADYAVLEGSSKNNRSRVVVHTAVPNANNDAGENWRDVVVSHVTVAKGSTTSVIPATFLALISGTRQADLDAGLFYEWEINVDYDANAAPAAKQAAIEAAIAAQEADMLADLQNELRWYGQTGTGV